MRDRASLSALAIGIALLTLAAAPAAAVRVESSVSGEVLFINPGSMGDNTAALGPLGVTVGAPVQMVLGIESTTPVDSVDAQGTTYKNAILDWTLTIGDFQATLVAGPLNQVVVSDNFQGNDAYTLSASVDTTDDVLGANSGAASTFTQVGGGAISNENVAQDLSAFFAGTVAIAGVDAVISVIFSQLAPAPPSRCLPGQIGAGAALCRAVLLCLSKIAPGPELSACIEKANLKFIAQFDKVGAKAEQQGDACPSGTDGASAALDLADDTDAIETLISTGADADSKDDTKYRAGLFKAAADAVSKGLKAYAKDAKKPDADKLEAGLQKVGDKLDKGLLKTEAKADKKGVDTDVDLDAVGDAVFELVDEVRELANGD